MATRSIHLFAAVLAASAVSSAMACTGAPGRDGSSTELNNGNGNGGSSSGSSGGGNNDASAMNDGGGAPPIPFTADPPSVYVAKVKNLLLGLPPSDSEIQEIEKDPTQLSSLINTWMTTTPYAALYTSKMLRFFQLAFQQTQVAYTDFANLAYPNQIAINNTTEPLLTQNLEESFARTMLAMASSNQPFSNALTSNQVMMTTALKEFYSFMDVWEVDNNNKVTDYWAKANPTQMITVGSASYTLSQSLTEGTPDYMHWTNPDQATANSTIPGCQADPYVYKPSAMVLHYLQYGSLFGHPNAVTGGPNCGPTGGSATAPILQPSDFTDWTMVTIKQPTTGQQTTTFYDVPTLRTLNTLVLNIPRVGFFSTPAFAANWATNTSNEMRVTMNQTLIVGLGAMVDGTDTTSYTLPSGMTTPPGLDTVHASQPACFACHQYLDPTRSILAANWSFNYHEQLPGDAGAPFYGQDGMFIFQGVVKPISSLNDLGNALATHPLFAKGWVQKLCYYADSAPCDENDPTFQKIVSDFTSSKYSWNALVKEMFSSPLITNASDTATYEANGEVVAVARRDHLCAALNNRLGFADICGLTQLYAKGNPLSQTIPQIVSGLPSDGYGRGAIAPVLPNQPSLFFRAGLENICEAAAQQVIDVPTAKQVSGVTYWSSKTPNTAITDFVSLIMGLTSGDPRAAQATTILTDHYNAALADKDAGGTVSTTEALESTFIAACLSPSFVSIGM